jgi:hypothetical protein
MHELLAGAEQEATQQKQKQATQRKRGGSKRRRRPPSLTMQRAHTDSDTMVEGRWRKESQGSNPQGPGRMDLESDVFYHFGEEEQEEGEQEEQNRNGRGSVRSEEEEEEEEDDTSRSQSFYSESDGDEDDTMFEKMQARLTLTRFFIHLALSNLA